MSTLSVMPACIELGEAMVGTQRMMVVGVRERVVPRVGCFEVDPAHSTPLVADTILYPPPFHASSSPSPDPRHPGDDRFLREQQDHLRRHQGRRHPVHLGAAGNMARPPPPA